MLLFIEGYSYHLDTPIREVSIRKILEEVVAQPTLKMEDSYKFEYVGYFYSKVAKDAVFILPKVVLTDGSSDTVFGASPMEIIDFNSKELESKFSEKGDATETKHFYKEFLSNLSIWIYRAIGVYKQQFSDSTILYPKNINTHSNGRRHKHNTLLDVIIALNEFNKKNQDYLTFIAKNQHSGYNKIQWTKTINHTLPIIQDDVPIYMDMVNKKKMINFDEELLIIYYSILNYIHQEYGFKFELNLNYPLISAEKIRSSYIDKKRGRVKLKQIKYKYFSDIALKIWNLCYAFFDREYEIAMNNNFEDYLLAKNFEHIFEKMIDELLGTPTDKDFPKNFQDQDDGKMIDHLFIGESLIRNSEQTYYIGDSKYYKRTENKVTGTNTTNIGTNSIAKQFTYAKNIIQYNLNLFFADNEKWRNQPHLRDERTEGYNVIPNFFISAKIPSKDEYSKKRIKYLSFKDKEIKPQNRIELNKQFENRLFDRDTLLICHYDVNFLYIVSLYGKNSLGEKSQWKDEVRKKFKEEVIATLNEKYEFYTIRPLEGYTLETAYNIHFRDLLGKAYCPDEDVDYMILALEKKEKENTSIKDKIKDVFSFDTEESRELQKQGGLAPVTIRPRKEYMFPFAEALSMAAEPSSAFGKNVLVGCFKSKNQLDWIQKNNLYNIRYGLRAGAVNVIPHPNKLVLYDYNNPANLYYYDLATAYTQIADIKKMQDLQYPEPKGEYILFKIDSVSTSSSISDVTNFLNLYKKDNPDYIDGTPIFINEDDLKE